VIYMGILGKKSELLEAKCGRPATLHGRPAYPWALFDSVFSRCILPIESSTFILWNGKIPRRNRGSLPLKSLNSSPSPSLLFQSFFHLLSCLGSLQCPVHYCRHEDDPSVERCTSHQGPVMCASHINRLGEGLRRCEGGHQRSQCAIGDDEQPVGQVPLLVGHCWWPIDPPRGGSAVICAPEFPCCLGPWFA
jgi:hypothetical protein